MNEEISFWERLNNKKQGNKKYFLKENHQNSGVYLDKINATRFGEDEIKTVKRCFSVSEVKRQCVKDVIEFSSVNDIKWKRNIGIKGFSALLKIIKAFRNSASHSGYILNKKCEYNKNILNNINTDSDDKISIENFVEILEYCISSDILDRFRYDVRNKMLEMNLNGEMDKKHITRLESIIGLSIIFPK